MDQPIIGITTEPNLVSHVLAIFTVLQQEHGMETLTENSPDVRALIEKLRITPVQAVLFSIVLNIQNDHSVSVGDIAKSIKAPSLMIVQYQAEIDSLVEKRLFRVYQGYPGRAAPAVGEGSLKTYRVPKNIIDAISHNEEWSPPSHTDLRFEDFFGILDNLFEQKIDNTISIDTLKFEISHLMRENPHLEFVEKVEGFGLSDDDLLVFLIFCNQAVDSDQKISFHMISSIYTRSRAMRMWREIVNENSTLQKLSLIESANNDGLGDDRFFTLTRKIKDDLLGDIVPKNPLGKKPKGWLSYKDIKAKELIYNEAEGERLSKLQKLLDKEQFQNVISRLESSNMRLGFACLFSGCPGTGKTESVLQIARCTQRDIFKVDISETKTKWFGESEKRIKEVFDRYRGLINSARKNQENIPILFFNEADGVFSKRQIIGGERTGPAQTENAIQNIILEELENLEGILIATTNLTINLDDAFERRFLYKIEFSKPDRESRKAIWQSMVSDLTNDDADILAGEYDFSGGQIENIARKRAIDSILTGETPALEDMLSMCRDEKMVKDTGKRIGFGV